MTHVVTPLCSFLTEFLLQFFFFFLGSGTENQAQNYSRFQAKIILFQEPRRWVLDLGLYFPLWKSQNERFQSLLELLCCHPSLKILGFEFENRRMNDFKAYSSSYAAIRLWKFSVPEPWTVSEINLGSNELLRFLGTLNRRLIQSGIYDVRWIRDCERERR